MVGDGGKQGVWDQVFPAGWVRVAVGHSATDGLPGRWLSPCRSKAVVGVAAATRSDRSSHSTNLPGKLRMQVRVRK